MKAKFLISIILSSTLQFIYGQAENSTGLKELNNNGNIKPITEKYYSTKYTNGEYKKENLKSTYVYNFNESGNIKDETAFKLNNADKQVTKPLFLESGLVYPTLNFKNVYIKNLNWKERMLNDYKQSSFFSEMLLEIVNNKR